MRLNVTKFLNRKLANLGFISKRKVAIEIAKQYVMLEKRADSTDDQQTISQNWYAQSQLNSLCNVLKIKPMHRNELGGGTDEIY